MESPKKSGDMECAADPSEDKSKNVQKEKANSGVQDVNDVNITSTPATNEFNENTSQNDNKLTLDQDGKLDIDSDSDFPDDFFDDFGKDEFMSALDPFDSFDEIEGEDNNIEKKKKQTNQTTVKQSNSVKSVNIKPADDKSINVKRRTGNSIFNKIFGNSTSEINLTDQRSIRKNFIPYYKRFENKVQYGRFPSGERNLRGDRLKLSPSWHEEEILNRPMSLSPPNIDMRSSRFEHDRIRNQRSRSPYEFKRNRDLIHKRSREDDHRRDSFHRRSHDDERSDHTHRRSHGDDHRRDDHRRRNHDDNHKRSHDDSDRRKYDDRRERLNNSFGPRIKKSAERNVGIEHLNASIADIRRDISKTRRAIQIDKDIKAKELFEKRIRIVETGLVPPGMETDVDIGRKMSHRDDKIMSRMPQSLEMKDHMREKPIKELSPSIRKRSPMPKTREPRRQSRESYRSSPRPTRPRSPFITEIARKLRERSEERHLMQALNPPDLVPQKYFPGAGMPYNYNPQQYFQSPYVPPHTYPIPPTMYPNAVTLPPQPNFFPGSQLPTFSTNMYQPDNFPICNPPTSTTYAIEPVPPPAPPLPVSRPEIPKAIVKLEPTLDDLLEQKKISVTDYMKLTMKPKGASAKEMSALNNKVELLSRCQNAVKKLSQFHKPNNLVYNPELEECYDKETPSVAFRSPLKRKQFIKYGFTTPLKLNKNQNDQILSNIVATIGLKNIIKENLEHKHIETIKDASVQTTSLACDFCQIRESTKFVSIGTDTDELYTTNSVHSQVTETDLQISKSMFIGVQAATQNPVSLTHLTPSQILASELAAKARIYRNNEGPSNQLPRSTQNTYQQNTKGYQKNAQGYQQNAQDYHQTVQDYQQKLQEYQETPQNYQQKAQDYQQKSQDYQQNAQSYLKNPPDYQQNAQGYPKNPQQNVQGYQKNIQGYKQNAQGYQKNPQGFQQSVQGYIPNTAQDQSNYGKNTYNNSNYNTYAWQ